MALDAEWQREHDRLCAAIGELVRERDRLRDAVEALTAETARLTEVALSYKHQRDEARRASR